MSEHARRARRRHAVPGPLAIDEEHRIGEEALHFARWFVASRYRLMGEFMGELMRAPGERDTAELQRRYCETLQHGQRVNRARGAVTLLLAMGALAAAASAVANALGLLFGAASLLTRVAAVATSLTVALVVARLLIDRYLDRVDVTAHFIAMQLATTGRAA